MVEGCFRWIWILILLWVKELSMFGKVVNLWSDMFHQTDEWVEEEDIVEDLELCREIEKYVA